MVAEFRGVAKSYGEKQVFAGVNFVINRGDRVGLVGVNGAGKVHAHQAAGGRGNGDGR